MTAGTAPADGDALTEAFEVQRPRLVRVAYATVGSVAEAEDCVQEAPGAGVRSRWRRPCSR
jgi:DNA-directed RNA polymerase specialized sigma24 family protein